MVNKNIYYISLGSFCHPKIIIRETNREYAESLPFDFNSTPNLSNISLILKELYKNKKYDLKLKEIICSHKNNNENKDELVVSDKNNMYFIHFFDKDDLILDEKYNDKYPKNPYLSINLEKIEIVKEKFKKRFERLLELINNKTPLNESIICFLRVEYYENIYWKEEIQILSNTLALFKHPRKYLIYSQKSIDENLHFDNSRSLNYNFNSEVPIFFFKYLFDEHNIRENDSYLFLTMLSTFEYLIQLLPLGLTKDSGAQESLLG